MADGDELENLEQSAAQGEPAGNIDQPEKLGKGFTGGPHASPGRVSRIVSLFARNKKKTAGGLIGGGVIGGGIFLFSFIQGPLQFIHFSSLLQQFHLRSNENFGDERSLRSVIYSLSGAGERGRLGFIGNKAADRFEKRLLDRHGVRFIYYDNVGGRWAGLEIVDRRKAGNITKQFLQGVDGSELKRVRDIEGLGVRGGKNRSLDSNREIIYLTPGKVSFFAKRNGFKIVAKNLGLSKIGTAVASRLGTKRVGLRFHYLTGAKAKSDERADKREKRRQKEAFINNLRSGYEEEILEGVRTGGVEPGASKDPEGNDIEDPDNNEVAGETKEIIDQFKRSGIVRTTTGSVAVVGIMCAAKGLGNNVEEYKYQNNALPMMRMGWSIISMGDQVKSGDDVSFDELEAYNESFYDERTKTSWTNARSIQAELGKKNPQGPDLPEEAKLKNIQDKPKFFAALDGVPLLSTTCSGFDKVLGLPIIKQVGDIASEAIVGAIDLVANRFDTSVDEAIEALVAAISGKSVDPEAKGAEFGNLANTGAFLASNDQALSMGGRPLSNQEVAQIKAEEKIFDKQGERAKSIAERYFNPYNSHSLVANVVANTPRVKQLVNSFFVSPLKSLASIFSKPLLDFLPKTSAYTGNYDYGIPKYGFSLDERSSDTFENPYENAAIVEPRLIELNKKYGECFSMEVVPEGSNSYRLESGDAVNVFEIEKDDDKRKKCIENPDPMLVRYRFYLADAVTAKSLACFEDDEQACAELGAGSSSSTETTETAESSINIADLKKDSTNIACAEGTKDAGVIDGYTSGQKVRIRLCEVTNLPQASGYGAKNGHATVNSRVSGAVYAMVKAAKNDGVNMSAVSSSRTMSDQQSLCPCDGVSVAIPGYSNHQLGVAIDFGGNGLLMDTSNPMWKWLDENASRFDYKPYEPEPWHWSPFGS